MLPGFLELERLTMVAPLGLQFHDTMSGALVGDGLSVWAYPAGRPAAKRRAIGNRRGVYVLHHAPGLLDLEHGNGTQQYWDQLPSTKSFTIEVSDDERRFQPFQFTTNLPVKGIYKWNGPNVTSPPAPMSSIPLYSSPVRSVPSGMAVVRADLWDISTDAPAAWAVLEAYEGEKLSARGVADDQGRVALIFPYPSPRAFAVSSPLGSPFDSPVGSPMGSTPLISGPPLTEQVWPLRLRALYTPGQAVSSPPNAGETTHVLPDLRSTLAQIEASIWADASISEPFPEAPLKYGRELILKSKPSPTSPLSDSQNSVLFISPAVSPP